MSSQQLLSDEVALSVTRCAACVQGATVDLPRLRDELHQLRESTDPRAQFATSLFDLERARHGDAEARESLTDVADALLVFWREGTGDEFARLHPALEASWGRAAALLASFDAQRFEASLSACWATRKDATALLSAIDALQPEGNRRVEFARCLYHLELARMTVDTSRVEFARRAGLLAEAWQDAEVARALVGDDAGLAELWAELVPYLDEFFETLEEAAERRRAETLKTDPGRSELKTDPNIGIAVSERRIPSFTSLTGQSDLALTPRGGTQAFDAEETIDLVDSVAEASPPPPPPVDLTPPGSWLPPRTASGEVELIEEVVEFTPIPPPPPPPSLTPASGVVVPSGEVLMPDDVEEAPDEHTLAFWSHTFTRLQLLPSEDSDRGARILSCESRAERKRLSDYVDSLGPFLGEVQEARAMGGLIRLMLAGQTREKTLFGQTNPRRAEAMAAALPFLSSSPSAAASVAVWFELDGAETRASLNQGLELLADYLSFCLRIQKDPLHPDAIKAYIHR